MRRERGQFSGHRVPLTLKCLRRNLGEGGIRLSMLPGFRFLLAAIVLSMSVLVFGLGAAALLRAAHEEFASNPTWRAAPEAMFAQQSDATRPVLAMLRVEPPPAERKASDNVPAVAESAAVASPPAEREQVAALKPEESLPETAKPEIPVSESPARSEAAPAQAEAPATASATKVASTEQVSPPAYVLPPANEAAPAASEPADASASPDTDAASTKIATLGGPPVAIETPASADSAIPDRSVAEKRLQARRAAHRRRMAARARQARLAQQRPLDPFAQPSAQPPAAAHH